MAHGPPCHIWSAVPPRHAVAINGILRDAPPHFVALSLAHEKSPLVLAETAAISAPRESIKR